MPLIKQIQASGVTTLRGIVEALAARDVPTARGGAWTPVQVSNLMRRAMRPYQDVRIHGEAEPKCRTAIER